eukprot:228729_1
MLVQDEKEKDDINLLANSYNLTNEEKEQYNSIYDSILKRCIFKVRIVICVSFGIVFTTSSRAFIIESYIQSISSLTIFDISSIIFAAYIWGALITFIMTTLGDKYGHDTLLLITYTLTTIGIFLESITTNLIIFVIGFFITRIAVISVGTAYIAFLLPHKYAVKHVSQLFTCISMAYLLGPMIAGIITDYINFRFVFWLNFIITCIFSIIILLLIYWI